MKPASERSRHFASDNLSGICPEAWEALAAANQGHAHSYGDDPWTGKAVELIQDLFETQCEVFFVFNGSAANSLALGALCQSYHSIICHEFAHVEIDECGGPEFHSHGAKVLPLPGKNGKLDPAVIEQRVKRRTDVHFPKVRAVSLTQATELGTVYSLDEIRAIGDLTTRLDLRFHMDGARFANALVTLAVSPKAITWQAGVDVLSFGGTKNGTAIGDAVVFFDRELGAEFEYRRKQAGQLASKMRFLTAPWVGMLEEGAWLKHATHANAMAALLAAEVGNLPGISILFPTEANAVFIQMPAAIMDTLHSKGWHFYDFAERGGGCRLMCSWDTTREDVAQFVADLKEALG
jgi:threonine aldolase